jgi:hypothetical protein
MRRERLDRERPRHPHALVVLVRLVVEQLRIRMARDRRVDLLARHPLRDVRIVRDRLEGHVRHALVDEAPADVAVRPVLGRDAPRDLRLLHHALGRVGQDVERELARHEARTGERQGHAARVDRDPAATPLLGDVGRGARSAGGIEDEVAGVGGHEDAALDDFSVGLHDVHLRVAKARRGGVLPQIVEGEEWEVVKVTNIPKRLADPDQSPRRSSSLHPLDVCLPASLRWSIDLPVDLDIEHRRLRLACCL